MAHEKEVRGPYRRYTAEFKREQIERVLRGECTAAELSREIGVARSQIQRWKYLLTKGGETAIASDADVVPAGALRAAQQRIRELERALGRKQMAIEILEAAQEEVKKKVLRGISGFWDDSEARVSHAIGDGGVRWRTKRSRCARASVTGGRRSRSSG